MKKMKRKTHAPAITWITTLVLLVSMCASFMFSSQAAAQSNKDKEAATQLQARETSNANYPMLSKYATDLTLLALRGKLETPRDHEADVARVIASLSVPSKAPVVVGESDLDRDAVARGVAINFAFGDVPDALRGKRVFRLSLDALAKGAKTDGEFAARVQAVFAEAAKAEGKVVLFVDKLHEYAGARATAIASATVKGAIEANHLRIIGGATPEAYATYIASDENVAKLFESISIDQAVEHASASSSATGKDKRHSPINEEFEGEKISADTRELMQSAGKNERVKAIIQVDDVHSREVSALLTRYGVLMGDSMAKLGAIKVDLPVAAIEALARSNSMNYISPDAKIVNLDFGHVVKTTGTDQVRNPSSGSLLGSLLGSTTIDGGGMSIAVIDSGVDTSHAAFSGKGILGTGYRVVFNKDFTTENNASTDPYGHGTHVASSAVGISTTDGDKYQGVAPGASIINLKVLDKTGVGSISSLLAALNWIISPVDPTKVVSSTNPLNKDKYSIRVVNMSLGAPAISTYKDDPICRAARALVDAGIVVVAAAGNNGKDAYGKKIYGGIHAPGNDPS